MPYAFNFTKAAKMAYYTYKVFQAARLFAGDVTVLAEMLIECLGEYAAQELLEAAAENMVGTAAEAYEVASETRESAKDLHESMRDFGKFMKKLEKDLGKDSPEAGENVSEARKLYESFVAVDTDGSGALSRMEFTRFYAANGTSAEVAREDFDLLDEDHDGEISFSEWTKIAVIGRPIGAGRDENSFNCVGHHGLESSKAISYETTCAWCRASCAKGSEIFACRRCLCNACLDCTATHIMNSCKATITCKPRHGLVKQRKTGTWPNRCDACGSYSEGRPVVFSCKVGSCAIDVCVQCMWNPPSGVMYSPGVTRP